MQLELSLARATGEAAAERCATKAEAAGFDIEGARRFVVGWLARHGAMSGESLVTAAVEHGHRPHDARAFGAVFATLARRNQIRCVRSDLPRARGHGTSGGRLWAVVR